MGSGDDAPAVSGSVIELERLVAMANQIGDFFSPYPQDRAAEGLRNHLRTYWDPRMRSALLAHIDAGGENLSELVIAGARLLQDDTADKDGYYGPPPGT